jgi:hypothetical protein
MLPLRVVSSAGTSPIFEETKSFWTAVQRFIPNAQKTFRRWLLRRRPVTEAVIRRNKNYVRRLPGELQEGFPRKNKIFLAPPAGKKTSVLVPLACR